MKMLKAAGKFLLSILFVVLIVSPVVALYGISLLERAQYNPKPQIILEELAYGDICPILRMDIEQIITASNAQIVSMSFRFLELKMFDDPYSIRFVVEVGDRINVNDVIGYYKGKEIKSTESGIIKKISIGSDSYVMLESLKDLAMVCYVNEEDYNWRQEKNMIKLGEDYFEIVKVEDVSTDKYRTRIVLKSDTAKLLYGEEYNSISFSTGKVFPMTLAVDARCVYSYPNSDKSYIRVVTDYGKFIQEIEVAPGYTNGQYICISASAGNSIYEGMYCDAGYKVIVEGLGE